MKGFSNRWKDFPDYIIGITQEIWEHRGVGTLNHYYADDIPVRSPMGVQRGNVEVMGDNGNDQRISRPRIAGRGCDLVR